MYLSHNSIIFILSCLTFAMYVEGFLLNPGQTSSPGITSQCISMDMYLAEKKELRNQIFQFQRENEQTLQLLTTQLQQKLTVMDDKLKQSNKPNDTIELAHLEQKNRDLEMNLTLLQEKHRLLQINYVQQKDQLDLLKSTSAEVIKELSNLKQLKSVNQMLDLQVVQSKIQSLEQKTALLTNNQNARSQDFLALYNVTRVTNKDLQSLGIHSLNQAVKQFTTESHFNVLKDQLHDIESQQNTSFTEIMAKVNSIESQVSNNSKQGYNEMLKKGETIAFSAYRASPQSLSDGTKVLFNQVWTNVGNGYQASTGIFTAPREGLYHFTAVVMSTDGGSLYSKIYHNKTPTAGNYIDGSGYKTGTFDVVFSLQRGDEVYITGDSGYTIYSASSNYITFSGHSIF